jgi:hypothetical protein
MAVTGFQAQNVLLGLFMPRLTMLSCRMPDVNQSFYDCRRGGESPAGHRSVQFCGLPDVNQSFYDWSIYTSSPR